MADDTPGVGQLTALAFELVIGTPGAKWLSECTRSIAQIVPDMAIIRDSNLSQQRSTLACAGASDLPIEGTLMTEFISDWSRQKLLCYDVRAAVVTALGYLELMRENNTITRTNLKIALKNTRTAAKKADELFQ